MGLDTYQHFCVFIPTTDNLYIFKDITNNVNLYSQAVQIIGENEKMKSRLRNLDAIHAERDELIQQLDTTKQELFTEQRKARIKIDELKEVSFCCGQ